MKKPTPAAAQQAVTDATYYGVVTFTVLVGLLAYSSGATLEGTLVRSAVALIACTALGFIANIILWLTASTTSAPAAVAAAQKPGKAAHSKIDVVADDDLEPELARSPVAPGR